MLPFTNDMAVQHFQRSKRGSSEISRVKEKTIEMLILGGYLGNYFKTCVYARTGF